MSKFQQQQQPNYQKSIEPELLKQFLDNENKKILNQATELRLREHEIKSAYDYNKEALKAQERFMQDTTKHRRYMSTLFVVALVLCFLIIIGLIVYCLSIEKESFAMDLIKFTITAMLSGGGGYFAGKSSAQKPSNNTTSYSESE